MGSVILNDIRIYAFHGCMEEEARIGSDYIVNLEVETNMEEASQSDDLEDAVDYEKLLDIIKKEATEANKYAKSANTLAFSIFSSVEKDEKDEK